MIKRIVKMSFKPDHVSDFVEVFKANWKYISAFEGCKHVELLQDETQPTIFFTYSLWQSEEHLNAYRNSELFNTVWGKTKTLFNNKPEAWTVKQLLF